MMENDVLTMRICKGIIERNWVLAHYQIRAVQEGRVAQGMAGHGGPLENLDALLQDLLAELPPEFLAACSAADMQVL